MRRLDCGNGLQACCADGMRAISRNLLLGMCRKGCTKHALHSIGVTLASCCCAAGFTGSWHLSIKYVVGTTSVTKNSNDCNTRTHAGRELASVASTAPAMVPEASLPSQIAPDVAFLAEGPDAEGVSESLGLNMAISSNATAQAASYVDSSDCGVPTCGQSCSDYTTSNAATLHNQNCLQYGTSSPCLSGSFPFLNTQIPQCCVQICSADSDCPTSYSCQPGLVHFSVCTKCDACATTRNIKCQEDQQCQFSCCLSATSFGCLAPGVDPSLSAVSGDMCCPSLPSSFPAGGYTQDGNSISCHCNTQQICSSVTSPQVNTAVVPVPPSPPPPAPPGSPTPPPPPPGVSLLSASL